MGLGFRGKTMGTTITVLSNTIIGMPIRTSLGNNILISNSIIGSINILVSILILHWVRPDPVTVYTNGHVTGHITVQSGEQYPSHRV